MSNNIPPIPPKFICKICDCTFTRKDNLIRHIVRKHNTVNNSNTQPNSHDMQPNSHDMQPNSHDMQPNSHDMQPNSHARSLQPKDGNVIKHICTKCNKELSKQWILQKHIQRCKGIINEYKCEYCDVLFQNKRSRYGHYKICKVKKEKDDTSLIPVAEDKNKTVVNNAEVINNVGRDQNTQNNNNVINILTFPQPGDTNFDFICDQITKATMKGLLQCSNTSQVGFNKFINKVMENPQNRIVHKTNPNCTYSKVHVGDGKWELAHDDDDVFPILTHHMTTAALGKVEEVNTDIQLVKELYNKLETFRNHVANINEMDYESEPYKGVLQRIKLIIVNLTRRWCEENGEELK